MLINRASGDAGRFAEKLAGERFAALLSAQQRRKSIKYELRRWNNAQHSGQFRQAGPTRSHSHSSSVVRITGIGFGWIGATTSFGSVVRKP
jgi:hypothetical protein